MCAWEDGGEDVHSIIGDEYDSHSNYLDPFTLTDIASFAAKPLYRIAPFDFEDFSAYSVPLEESRLTRKINTIPHQTQSIIPLSSDATSIVESPGLTSQTLIEPYPCDVRDNRDGFVRLEQTIRQSSSTFDADSFGSERDGLTVPFSSTCASSNVSDSAHPKPKKCTQKYVESQVNEDIRTLDMMFQSHAFDSQEAPPIFDANIFAFLVVMVLISATKSTHRLLMALFWLNFTACKAYESAPKKLGPYYVYESAPKKWNDAESYCQTTYGTHLATIWDDQAADELVTLFQTGGRLWIGLNDKDVEGKWVYAGDGTGTFWWRLCGLNCDWIKYWADGQPSNSDGAEDCGQVFQANRDSMVNDDRCEKTYPFACNKPKPFYVYESAEKNWDEAEAYCQTTYGTHLATIWNDEAAEELMILSEISDWFWMGLNDKDVEGTWVYVDGSADSLCGGDCGSNQDYKYWDSNQPNGGGDCGATTGDQDISSMLHDYSCTQKLPFACNKPKYYVFGIAEKNWNDAEAYCQTTYGTHLATIWNDEAAEELMTLSHMLDFFWIGLNDKDEEGTWVYTDGSSNSLCGGDCASIKYWIDGQPDDWQQNEHCGHVKPHSFDDISSMINDIGCTRSFPFACNKPKTWHYLYESAPKKWNDAEAYCQSAYGTHLATIW
eukprot:1150153_1